MPSNATFLEVKNAFQSIAGLESLTAADEFFLTSSLNRAVYRAYNESDSWPRYLVVGESRLIITDPAATVPYAEAAKETIGEFLRVHRTEPFLSNSALEFEFYVDSVGAHILNLTTSDSTSVFVTYKKELQANFTPDSTDIPAEFVDYIIYTALTDFYTGDGQTEKAAVAASQAKMMLDIELLRLDKKANNNTINKKFSTYVNRQSRQHLCYNIIMSSSRNNTLEFSSVGSDILEAADAVTGKRYGALQIINDTVFSALTASNVDGSSKLVGPTIAAGTVIYGAFSEVTVTSGIVAAHKYQYAPKPKEQSRQKCTSGAASSWCI